MKNRLLLLLLFITLIAFMIFNNINLIKKFYHTLLPQSEYGTFYIPMGDRQATIEFQSDFRSPPIVTLSKSSLTNVDYVITNVTDTYFKVEVSKRHHFDLEANWNAIWTPMVAKEYINNEAGMPASFQTTFESEAYDVFYTGYNNYLPIELFIPKWKIADSDIQTQFKASLLSQLESEYKSLFHCGWFKKKMQYFSNNKHHCMYDNRSDIVSSWIAVKNQDWLIDFTDSGLRLYQKTAPNHQINQLGQKLKELLKNVKFADISIHNNQMLDFIDVVSKKQKVSDMTLIHFDTHSDMYLTSDPRKFTPQEMIGDFINTLMANGNVNEVYWVLPDWTLDKKLKDAYWDINLPESEDIIYGSPYLEGPTKAVFYIDKNTGAMFPSNESEHSNIAHLRKVKVHKVTLKDLPSFRNRQNIILEFDADYFSNSGHDSTLAAAFNPSKEELILNLSNTVETLIQKSVEPALFYMCLSPKYVTVEDQVDMMAYIGSALINNQQKDLLSSYQHNIDSGKDPQAVNKLRDETIGNILFQSLIFEANSWPGDQIILLDKDDKEYQYLLNNIINKLQLSQYEAESLLIKIDRLDGEANDQINIIDFEYYQAKENALSDS